MCQAALRAGKRLVPRRKGQNLLAVVQLADLRVLDGGYEDLNETRGHCFGASWHLCLDQDESAFMSPLCETPRASFLQFAESLATPRGWNELYGKNQQNQSCDAEQ